MWRCVHAVSDCIELATAFLIRTMHEPRAHAHAHAPCHAHGRRAGGVSQAAHGIPTQPRAQWHVSIM